MDEIMADAYEGNDKVTLILEAIRHNLDPVELKQILSRVSVVILTSWKDENCFDLVHHCILQNNIVALMLLLTRGHFNPTYEPGTWPYLHLVACLGHRTLVSSIIQEVKYQNETMHLNWNIFDKIIRPRIHFSFPDLGQEKDKKFSPIDVAAHFGHTGCVRLLLDFWQAQKQARLNRKYQESGSSYLLLACQASSHKALQLLLNEQSDKKEALEYAIRMSAPECVDIVLQNIAPADVRRAFQGMNLYHVLYSYSSCLTAEQFEAMVPVTSILISHNQEVNISQPLRTFPLYSLLSHSTSSLSFKQCGPSLMASLRLLLQAGADPNMDEIQLEDKLENPEQSTAFGRRSYFSAIHCLLENLPSLKFNAFEDQSEAENVDTYAVDAIELLLKYGADLSSAGKFHPVQLEVHTPKYHSGTALHVLLSTRPQNPISQPLLRTLLHNGLDVDTHGFWGVPNSNFVSRYALNLLPFSIWSLPIPRTRFDERHIFKPADLETFIYVMKFMSQSCLVQAYWEFKSYSQMMRHGAKIVGRLEALDKLHLQDNAMFAEIVNEFEKRTKEPWSLQQCCCHSVWRACRMYARVVDDLPIPGPLKRVIMSFH